MNISTLAFLRCPYCGTRLEVVENEALVRDGDRIEQGVLGCECCAYPVMAGIPVLIADARTRDAMHAMEAGRREDALFSLLDLEGERADAFRTLGAKGDRATYREGLAILSRDAEGNCFLYRLSDPTYLVAEAMLTGLGRKCGESPAPLLDLCSGSGHVTRVLTRLRPKGGVVAADLFFWKLWLAKRFVAPESQPVCCDGNHPLPFARESFPLVVLADAFPYIWHKRLLAGEMVRCAAPGGLIVMPHLHSSLGWNYSQGDTLTPAAYCDLFIPLEPHLFSDTQLRNDLIERRVVDLSAGRTPDGIGEEPSFSLIAQKPMSPSGGAAADDEASRNVPHLRRQHDVFRRYDVEDGAIAGALIVNPLYRVERQDSRSILTLEFPTPEYGDEFGECRRYLPDTITLEGDLTAPIDPASLGEGYADLRRRRIIVDAPKAYV